MTGMARSRRSVLGSRADVGFWRRAEQPACELLTLSGLSTPRPSSSRYNVGSGRRSSSTVPLVGWMHAPREPCDQNHHITALPTSTTRLTSRWRGFSGRTGRGDVGSAGGSLATLRDMPEAEFAAPAGLALVHRLKSEAGLMGFDRLARACDAVDAPGSRGRGAGRGPGTVARGHRFGARNRRHARRT